MLFVARYDGVIDVWDFTDQSHKPAHDIVVGLSPINSMEFWTSPGPPEKATVLLAVSDLTGALHILQLAKHLSRPVTNEKVLISAYFDRELGHCEYVSKRQEGHSKDARDRSNAAGGGGDDGGAGGKGKTREEKEEAAEAEYKALEDHYRDMFGL